MQSSEKHHCHFARSAPMNVGLKIPMISLGDKVTTIY